jgi:hypothetical protein
VTASGADQFAISHGYINDHVRPGTSSDPDLEDDRQVVAGPRLR